MTMRPVVFQFDERSLMPIEKLRAAGVKVLVLEKSTMKFRKKPIVIEAVQWLNKKIVVADDGSDPLEWFFQAEQNKTIRLAGDRLLIRTLEGEMTAEPGDWIIRGIKGEIYPCKPDIFEATYERVE